jgi:hypothetical protein
LLLLGALLAAAPAWAFDFGCDRRFGWDTYQECVRQESWYNAQAVRKAWRQRDAEIERLQRRVDELDRAQQKDAPPEDTPENRRLLRELEDEAARHGY